jgi:hypothetical protein
MFICSLDQPDNSDVYLPTSHTTYMVNGGAKVCKYSAVAADHLSSFTATPDFLPIIDVIQRGKKYSIFVIELCLGIIALQSHHFWRIPV